MLTKLSLILCPLLLTTLTPTSAQTNPPPIVIELSGVEPPPPGIDKELNFGVGGGGGYCENIEPHRIAGSGFSPPLQNGGFGLFIDCIEDPTNPLAIYFYGDSSTDIRPLLATKYITTGGARSVFVQVKISRSFPVDSSKLAVLVTEGGGFPGNAVGHWKPAVDESICRGSFPQGKSGLEVDKPAYVTRPQGLDLVSATDGSGTKLALLRFATPITITGNPVCSFDGLAYWKVAVSGVNGWLPQGDLATNWLNAYAPSANVTLEDCPRVLPPKLLIGQRAQVAVTDGSPANVRYLPDGPTRPFTTIPERTQVTIVSAPFCGNNDRGETVVYRLVQLDDGTKGWVIEVTPSLRVLEPATQRE